MHDFEILRLTPDFETLLLQYHINYGFSAVCPAKSITAGEQYILNTLYTLHRHSKIFKKAHCVKECWALLINMCP